MKKEIKKIRESFQLREVQQTIEETQTTETIQSTETTTYPLEINDKKNSLSDSSANNSFINLMYDKERGKESKDSSIFDLELKPYGKFISNNFSTFLSSNTSMISCFFNRGSLDQIEALLSDNDKANKGASFKCGDIFSASDLYFSYSDLGMISMNFNKRANIIKNCSSSNLQNLSTLGFIFNNSSNICCGTINLTPLLFNNLSIFLTEELGWKNANRTLVSNMSIFYNPCLLATLCFNSSDNSLAFSSVSCDFSSTLSARISKTSSSTSSIACFNSNSFLDCLTNSENFLILLNSLLRNATNSGCKSMFQDLISCSKSAGISISTMSNFNNDDYISFSIRIASLSSLDDKNSKIAAYADNNENLINLSQNEGKIASERRASNKSSITSQSTESSQSTEVQQSTETTTYPLEINDYKNSEQSSANYSFNNLMYDRESRAREENGESERGKIEATEASQFTETTTCPLEDNEENKKENRVKNLTLTVKNYSIEPDYYNIIIYINVFEEINNKYYLFNISQKFSSDSKFNSTIIHLFIICNKNGICKLGTGNKDRIKTTNLNFSSHVNKFLNKSSFIDYLCSNVSDKFSYLNPNSFYSSEFRSYARNFYNSCSWNKHVYFFIIYFVHESGSNFMNSFLLLKNRILFSSPWLEKSFDNNTSIKSIIHAQYSLSRICLISSVGSLSDLELELSNSLILNKDFLGFFDCLDFSSSINICNSLSTFNNLLTNASSIKISNINDYLSFSVDNIELNTKLISYDKKESELSVSKRHRVYASNIKNMINVPEVLAGVKSPLKVLASDSVKLSVTFPLVLSQKETSHLDQGTMHNSFANYINFSNILDLLKNLFKLASLSLEILCSFDPSCSSNSLKFINNYQYNQLEKRARGAFRALLIENKSYLFELLFISYCL